VRYYIGMTIETTETSKEGLRFMLKRALELEALDPKELDITYQPYPVKPK
jgi:hypothetical protein